MLKCPTRKHVLPILFQQIFCSLSAPNSTAIASIQAHVSLRGSGCVWNKISVLISAGPHCITMEPQIPFLTSLVSSPICKTGILKLITEDSMIMNMPRSRQSVVAVFRWPPCLPCLHFLIYPQQFGPKISQWFALIQNSVSVQQRAPSSM